MFFGSYGTLSGGFLTAFVLHYENINWFSDYLFFSVINSFVAQSLASSEARNH